MGQSGGWPRPGRDEAATGKLLDLLRRLRAGEDAAACYEAIDGELRPRLRRYFGSHGFSDDRADDLVQETLLRVYRGVIDLRDDDRLMPWLFTIARNVRFTGGAAVSRERELFGGKDPSAPGAEREDRATGAPSPETEQLASEQHASLAREVAALPPMQRQCLLLRIGEDLSYEEIAALLKLSPNTVRNHLALARRTLSARLGPSGEGT